MENSFRSKVRDVLMWLAEFLYVNRSKPFRVLVITLSILLCAFGIVSIALLLSKLGKLGVAISFFLMLYLAVYVMYSLE